MNLSRHSLGLLPPALLAVVAIAGCGSASKSSVSSAHAGGGTTRSTAAAPPGARSSPAPGRMSRGHGPDRMSPGHGLIERPRTGTTASPIAPVPAPRRDPPPEPGCPRGVVPCVTKTLALKPVGSPNLGTNLTRAILRDHRLVRSAVVSCPRLKRYPTRCSLRGSAVVAGSLRPILGTITVLGVETSTRTYAYSLLYSAARS